MSDNILDILKRNERTLELSAGVHNNVKLIEVDVDDRKDGSGNRIKKQLFLTFKKLDENGDAIGEKEISFFDIDPVKDYAVDNLLSYISSVRDILEVFIPEKTIDKKFDPLQALLEKNEEGIDEKEFYFDNIKKTRLKKMSKYKLVEEAIRKQFYSLVKSKIGYDSISLRLKLEEDKNNYINIPRYGAFIEKGSIDKKESRLITKVN